MPVQHTEESAEDYLERILMLSKKNGSVRSIDIAQDMNFSKPSVSVAMKKLREKKYIEVDKNGFITLTPEGYKIASEILERHEILTSMLLALGVSEKNAYVDACRIEHDLSYESFQAIKNHYLKIKK